MNRRYYSAQTEKHTTIWLKMAQVDEVLRGGIPLPKSSARNERDCFVKLLSSVDPEAEHGFGFEGVLYRAGQVVTPAQLRPDPTFPEIPIALEYARIRYGPRKSDQLYILWRLQGQEWRELGRAVSQSWEWAVDLRPLAVRALREARSSAAVEVLHDLPQIARRIGLFLDQELGQLEPRDRVRVIGVLHDQLAARLVA